jgi:hypothetical protein
LLTFGDSIKKKCKISEAAKHINGPVCFGLARGKKWQITVATNPTATARRNIGNNVEIVM